ncbi:cytoskeleton-associated protein 2-like isoform X2 [Ornithorhynchus anatinus]|uniref:cytoskeleton-associated protein 2-like isoform X2 n=1 Tax=Ornithorhynchus anatinus TaxID=9258 RepID=UPI0004549F8C|nr:cytoskeleton-associated protein 2-like isoform X2 [Ornithorhynchus anatinus]
MEAKENTNETELDRNSQTVERNGASLKATTVLTNLSVATGSQTPGDSSQIVQMSPTEENNSKIQRMSFSQAFLMKRNQKEEQLIAEKLPQNTVLGYCCSKVVQSKINSFRRPLPGKDERSLTRAMPSAMVSKLVVRPPSTSGGAIKDGRISDEAISSKFGSPAPSQIKSLMKPPLRSHYDAIPKQTVCRASGQVTDSKESRKKRLLLSNSVPSTVKKGLPPSQAKPTLSNVKKQLPLGKPALVNAKADALDELENMEAMSQTVTSRAPAKPDPSTLRVKSMGSLRSTLLKDSVEDRRARLAEWKASKGRVLKRPPISMPLAQSKMKEQQMKSFRTTTVEEEEQKLFTEKVNSFAECLKLINKGCPREEVLNMLEKVVQNIPNARKSAKYWVCLARLEPTANPVQDILVIYEKAMLAGAKPIEELRHAVSDILKKKNLPHTDVGENVNMINTTEEGTEEVSGEVANQGDTDASWKSEREDLKNRSSRKRVGGKIEEQQDDDDTPKDSNDCLKTPAQRVSGAFLIKYNVSNLPNLQSAKKMMQLDVDSSVMNLKFLTPVRRSRRFQDKTCELPTMLKDHHLCISSLEQLAELGAETSCFVYQQNEALPRIGTEAEEPQRQ